MLYFVQQLANGITLGSIYALIAIGYTLVYGILGMINFAHGEIYMIGAYLGIITIGLAAVFGISSTPVALFLALLVAVVVTAAYGWTMERIAYRPLRRAPRLSPLISAIGMSLFFQNAVQLAQGAKDLALPPLLPGGFVFLADSRLPIQVSYVQAILVAVTVTVMAGLGLFIRLTRTGMAMRALEQDQVMAALLGVDVDRTIGQTFILGSALAALAGVLVSLHYGLVNFSIGFLAGIKAFTAAVLGGIGSVPGAMLGGVFLGLIEAMTSAYLSTELKDVFSFGILALVLIVRPTGILGRPHMEKV
ncbi:MAG: branched-chain amino acid ABC transporter permease LivH [Thermodesulfobacteriota bacterium]